MGTGEGGLFDAVVQFVDDVFPSPSQPEEENTLARSTIA